MARFEETSAFCPHCQKQVLARTRKYISWPWFVLGILFIPFLLVWVVSKIYWRPVTRCSICGAILKDYDSDVEMNKIIAVLVGFIIVVGFSFFVFTGLNTGGAKTNEVDDTEEIEETAELAQPKAAQVKLKRTPAPVSTPGDGKSYKSGYEIGFFEARRRKMNGEPDIPKADLQVSSEYAAAVERKSGDEEWRRGWQAGFTKGFKSDSTMP